MNLRLRFYQCRVQSAMKCITFLFLILASGYLQVVRAYNDSTVVLVHTLFRHGNRNPGSEIYPTNPYGAESFYPAGYGQLSNAGKATEFKIGTTLRTRYNESFLAGPWNINYVDAWSTNVNRTKMSLQLVLASLWPPSGDQVWRSSLAWQPIPYNYYSKNKELSGPDVCTNFATMSSEVEASDEMQAILSQFSDVYEYCTNKSGKTFNSPSTVFSLYFDSYAQNDTGYPLESWLDPVFPETLENITKYVYYIETYTTALKKIGGGFLLRKIINDSKAKINGTLSPSERKLFLYSAHEKNVALFLLTLGVFEDKIPAYGSHVILELHLIDGVYGFKVFYNDWTTDEPYILTIPNCEEFCPIDDFVELLSDVIPEDSDCEQS